MPFPNEATQFKPGGPGGPGRPPFRTVLDILKKRVEGPMAEKLVDAWLEMVIAHGDAGALRDMMNRLYGKVRDEVHHDGGMTIKVVYDDIGIGPDPDGPPAPAPPGPGQDPPEL